jgi:sugar/nucleoside kinase (ribokinase family)
MYNLIAIGDPIIDTQVRLDHSSSQCQVIPLKNLKLCFDYGSKVPIIDSFQSLGGNAANVSIGATRLGLKSAVLSTIGNDVSGQMIIKELARYGVGTEFVSVDPDAKSRYSIVLNYEKERTILSYSSKKNYTWPKQEPETDWIYYTGLSEGFETVHENLMRYLKKHLTTKLAFNPGSYLMKYGRKYLPEIIGRADLLIVNLEEAESALSTAMKKEKNVRALIHALIAKGAKEVVITDAERGAWAGNSTEVWHMNAYPVPVVAKTGAGDSFSAAYLSARFHGHDIKNALIWGITNSASVVQYEDCHTGLLTQAGIQNFLAQYPHIEPVLV